jgi:hypothetical protein
MVARSLLKCAVALVVLWPVSSSAQLFNFDNIDMGAKTVDIGGVSVHVPSPASFCGFDESNPIDAMVLAQIRLMNPNNVPLAIYIDCGELNDIRAGTRQYMSRYLSVGTTQNALYENFVGREAEMAADACGNMSAERALGESIDSMRQRMQTFAEGTDLQGMEPLGVVKQTADTCYTAFLVKTNIEGVTITQVNVIAAFILKGKLVVINDYTSYYPGALDTLLAEAETYAASLRNSNVF